MSIRHRKNKMRSRSTKRKPSSGKRMQKFLRRHRLGFRSNLAAKRALARSKWSKREEE